MSDSNAGRDKGLESIARSLGNIAHELKRINERLAQIEYNTRRVKFTNHPYERPDAFDVPQQPQPGKDDEVPVMSETQKFPDPSHPYLRRSTPDGGANNAR